VTAAEVRAVRPYCLIGGLAVNYYVEPVYSLDAEPVVIAASLPELTAHLEAQGFKTELRIQFTTDERYQAFPARSVAANVLGMQVKVACREDVTQGSLWAYGGSGNNWTGDNHCYGTGIR